jgi:hypothetical protein
MITVSFFNSLKTCRYFYSCISNIILVLAILYSEGCSQKFYTSEVLSIFPEVNGKVNYHGQVQVDSATKEILQLGMTLWLKAKDSTAGMIRVKDNDEVTGIITAKVKKRLLLNIPWGLITNQLDARRTFFEFSFTLQMENNFYRYELKDVKAWYYQYTGKTKPPDNTGDLIADIFLPVDTEYGRYDPLPVSNNLHRGYAELFGRDNLLKFYTDIDSFIKSFLASLNNYLKGNK